MIFGAARLDRLSHKYDPLCFALTFAIVTLQAHQKFYKRLFIFSDHFDHSRGGCQPLLLTRTHLRYYNVESPSGTRLAIRRSTGPNLLGPPRLLLIALTTKCPSELDLDKGD